jgi:hypothetical protein
MRRVLLWGRNFGHRREVQALHNGRYEIAERCIREILRQAEASYKAHELVERLGERGVPKDIGSATMWDMIGAGEVVLSNDWHVSLAADPVITS